MGKMLGVGKHLRALFEQQVTDAAELKRRGREWLGLPSRMPKRLTDAQDKPAMFEMLRPALAALAKERLTV
ncbi:hypothetical protein CcrC1_gp225c [Caulobacter phage C1]|nr:hypothetical protein CcrC1_gp225c [Caulobacter phage C1]UTU08454.1 hypothetical protein CcrC2_gp226c [Caulobacter phage C2]UTU08971.1 hypothetical protein CcrJ4_gp220c [Caulobacter phage J4]UTU09530.1 hypothetical protein CcrBL47_gp244c [Caulobacter phage BL47]UTU10087.1 hypothetical protein CcrRB23_gp225c [Caulobacter phage RB23]WGN97122.1 hypothetical protein [Bertelyvirus sp.]